MNEIKIDLKKFLKKHLSLFDYLFKTMLIRKMPLFYETMPEFKEGTHYAFAGNYSPKGIHMVLKEGPFNNNQEAYVKARLLAYELQPSPRVPSHTGVYWEIKTQNLIGAEITASNKLINLL